ncbi:aspartate/glutamate racemase family protein [Sulfurospirillum arcachonense]|uniref:aspartate/glutamate racemase family protein n=1 Tax=Sulfurospirillum arcachonense TaxID=57666 RepID=UPI000467FADF|nr:aspartate/glutamate racemase family protein [Sulfurospirillum arcachonense]
MKTIGLLGGMSWESTLSYYKLLNEGVRDALGGVHSAKIIMHSVDFAQIEELQSQNRWDEAGKILNKHAKALELGGADFILICTNTMHKIVDQISLHVNIPIIHIAKAASEKLNEENCKKTILLGTRFTMAENFYKEIIEHNNIKVITPNQEDMKEIDRIIFEELVMGKILQESKEKYINIIEKLYSDDNKIDSVILGCTEIGLLIKKSDINFKIFDTTSLHVNKALQLALQK